MLAEAHAHAPMKPWKGTKLHEQELQDKFLRDIDVLYTGNVQHTDVEDGSDDCADKSQREYKVRLDDPRGVPVPNLERCQDRFCRDFVRAADGC